MTTSVIVAGARTPVGKLMGSLKDFSGSDLGGVAIKGALEKAGVPASAVEYVIMGQVLTAGAGQMPARQAAVAAGIGWDVPSLTINKMCLSGIDAIALADQLIRAGEFDVVVAGGQESMTKAPHLLMDSRAGYKYGDVTVLDHIADEVVSVKIPQRNGDPLEFGKDEGIRAYTTAESLSGLKPAFRKNGTITAGSASPISDGAAAVVVMSKDKATELGLTWLVEIGAHSTVAGPDSTLQSQPANAIKKAIDREGITVDQLDVVEINEAFAAVALASMKELGVDPQKVNVDGGAIAIGHPIGMSGARITLHAALELARRGSGYAVAALCGGGGQGDALILRR